MPFTTPYRTKSSAGATSLRKPVCIGHRGACGYETENTLESFRRAVTLGAPWVECDVQCVENHLVVFHDRNLRAKAKLNGAPYHGIVTETSFDLLRTLTVGNGAQIPLLSEVLETIGDTTGINIELKSKGCAHPLSNLLSLAIQSGWRTERMLISSFDHTELAHFHELQPDIPIGLLVYGSPLHSIRDATDVGACTICTDLSFLTRERVDEAHEAGLNVLVYTVNDPDDINLMATWGVDGIFCDYPDRAL